MLALVLIRHVNIRVIHRHIINYYMPMELSFYLLEIPADAYLLLGQIMIGCLLLKSRVLQAHWLILGNSEKAQFQCSNFFG